MVRVELRPSRYIAVALTAAHSIATVTVLLLDVPVAAKLVLAIAIIASLAQALWRHAFLRSRSALTALELSENDCAAVQSRDGRWHEARVLGSTYVSPMLSVINLRVPARFLACHFVVTRDNSDTEAFRRLRVRLRWSHK